MKLIVGFQEKVWDNSAVHITNTKSKYHLHRPVDNLSWYRKSTSLAGTKISEFHYTVLYKSYNEWKCSVYSSIRNVVQYSHLV